MPRPPKSPNNVESNFIAVHLLPKDRRFEQVDAKLVSCPGRHLTSVPGLVLPGHSRRSAKRADHLFRLPGGGRASGARSVSSG